MERLKPKCFTVLKLLQKVQPTGDIISIPQFQLIMSLPSLLPFSRSPSIPLALPPQTYSFRFIFLALWFLWLYVIVAAPIVYSLSMQSRMYGKCSFKKTILTPINDPLH